MEEIMNAGAQEAVKKKVFYGQNVFDIDDPNISEQDIKQSMVEIFPELATSTMLKDEEGNFHFQVKGGVKGVPSAGHICRVNGAVVAQLY